MKQFFHVVGVKEDTDKIDHVALYLDDTAMVWWHQRHTKIKRATVALHHRTSSKVNSNDNFIQKLLSIRPRPNSIDSHTEVM